MYLNGSLLHRSVGFRWTDIKGFESFYMLCSQSCPHLTCSVLYQFCHYTQMYWYLPENACDSHMSAPRHPSQWQSRIRLAPYGQDRVSCKISQSSPAGSRETMMIQLTSC